MTFCLQQLVIYCIFCEIRHNLKYPNYLVPPRPLTEVLLDRSTSDDSHRTDVPSSAQSTDDSKAPVDAGSRTTPPDGRLSPRSPQAPASLVDVDAEIGAELISTAIADPVGTDTSSSMTTNGLSLKYQSDTLVANIRGRHERSLASLTPRRSNWRASCPSPPRCRSLTSPPSLVRLGQPAGFASPWPAGRWAHSWAGSRVRSRSSFTVPGSCCDPTSRAEPHVATTGAARTSTISVHRFAR